MTTTLEPLISDPITELQESTVQNLRIALGLLQETGVGQLSTYCQATDQYCSLGAVAAARTGLRGPEVRKPNPMVAGNEWLEVNELAETVRSKGGYWPRVKSDAVTVFAFNDSSSAKAVEQVFMDTIARLS